MDKKSKISPEKLIALREDLVLKLKAQKAGMDRQLEAIDNRISDLQNTRIGMIEEKYSVEEEIDLYAGEIANLKKSLE